MYKQLNAAEGHIYYDMNFKICVTLTSNVRVCYPLLFQGQSNGCDKGSDRMGSNFREISFSRIMNFLYIKHQHSKNEISELPERQYYQKIAQERLHSPPSLHTDCTLQVKHKNKTWRRLPEENERTLTPETHTRIWCRIMYSLPDNIGICTLHKTLNFANIKCLTTNTQERLH